ncbi:hypothetical protein ACH4FX_42425 [Streptomyces sp. NPDC018019]|uniref:hypothetical protein n=1 Tax=Streptomyces sp. NPDC018019 TaxID=3365030 RepID=UPI0037A18D02
MTSLGIGRFPGVITRQSLTALSLTATALGAGLATASPASAGGIGAFLSPAFSTVCGNLNNGAHADGTTTGGTGTAGGNRAGIPLGSALNHCGGADLLPNEAGKHDQVIGEALENVGVDAKEVQVGLVNVQDVPVQVTSNAVGVLSKGTASVANAAENGALED